MKMRYYFIPFIFLVFFSCSQNKVEGNESLAMDVLKQTLEKVQKVEITMKSPEIFMEVLPPPAKDQTTFTEPVIIENDESLDERETYNMSVDTKGSFPVINDETTSISNLPNQDEVFTIVEVMPEFKGGEKALIDYLSKNIEYPATARDMGIQGKVYVCFNIDKLGGVNDAFVVKGIGGGCDQEALRVVSKMPDWIPGRQNGNPVTVKFTLPVNFKLE